MSDAHPCDTWLSAMTCWLSPAVVGLAPLLLGPLASADPAQISSLRNPKAVVFCDFMKMQPPGAVRNAAVNDAWYLRTNATFMACGDNVLLPGPGDAVPDLTYAPGLEGRYNLYIGLRAVGHANEIQFRTNTMPQYATVRLAPHHPVHVNHDILWAVNVPMAGRTIEIHAVEGRVYLDYLSFVPTAADREDPQISELVEFRSRRENTDLAAFLGKHDRRVYRDTTPLPELRPESRKRGFMLFTRPWMDLVFPNTMPSADTGSLALSCRAARGEYEPVTFALRALRDLASVTVTVEQLPTTGAVSLPAAAIDVRRVRRLHKRTTRYSGRSEYMDMPMYAESVAPHTVRQNTTQAYWLTVRVPRDTTAGTYTGRIAVREAGRVRAAIPLHIVVYPFTLPPLQDVNFGMYYSRRGNDVSDGTRQAVLDAFLDMRRHGLNSVAWFGPLDAPLSGHAPALTIELDKASITMALDAFKRAGMTGDFLWGYTSFEALVGGLLPDEDAYERAHVAIAAAVLAEARKRQWPRIIFQPFDEVPSLPDRFPALHRELRCLKKAGATTEHDHLWLKTNRGDLVQRGIDRCAPLIDIFTLRYSSKSVFYVDPWQEILRQARAMGRSVYTYNINNGLAISELESMRFGTGWFFRTVGNGCRGYYLWAYQYCSGSFYNDFDGATDWVQQYPPAPHTWQTLGGPALYWEALREGIDDLKYIQLLERLTAAARTDPPRAAVATAATKLLADLAASVDVARLQRDCAFLECKWERSGQDKNGTRWAEGRFRLPNGWTFERYDEARHAVADMITRLIDPPVAPHRTD